MPCLKHGCACGRSHLLILRRACPLRPMRAGGVDFVPQAGLSWRRHSKALFPPNVSKCCAATGEAKWTKQVCNTDLYESAYMDGPIRARSLFHSDCIRMEALCLCWSMILSDLASPAEARFAKAGNRCPPRIGVRGMLFGIMLYREGVSLSAGACKAAGGMPRLITWRSEKLDWTRPTCGRQASSVRWMRSKSAMERAATVTM